ncbi:MAG: GntR family transcriptional regulator [Oscillospiraceae bacterium]|nr:GntR family transcriptional regulator [Oscillospiraceae bacterium]
MISLNFRDSRPIYEQLRENLRQMILSGAIGAEEKLPSVRELASDLAINPNTIMRAYRELEAAGYIYTIPGKGSFAAPLNEVHDETRNKLLAQFSETARALLQLGLQQEELSGIIQKEAKQID